MKKQMPLSIAFLVVALLAVTMALLISYVAHQPDFSKPSPVTDFGAYKTK